MSSRVCTYDGQALSDGYYHKEQRSSSHRVFYASNDHAEWPWLFRQIELFLTKSRRVGLVEDWTAVLDTDMNHIEQRSRANNTDVKPFWVRFDLVDKCRSIGK